MTKIGKVSRFTAITGFLAAGLMLIALAIRLWPPDGRLDWSNLAGAILFAGLGAYNWRRWKSEERQTERSTG